jgi:UDP:flavonoid glycosyltransferase YjiC (YdhE family)
MRITVIALGVRTDIPQMIVLSRRLCGSGHDVCVAAESTHREAVVGAGLSFFGLSEIPNDQLAETVENALPPKFGARSRTSPYAAALAVRSMGRQLRNLPACCERADLVICEPILGLAPSLSEKLRIPAVIAAATPEIPTREFPFPGSEQVGEKLTAEEIWLSWRGLINALRMQHRPIQQWRVEGLGLSSQTFRQALERTQSLPHILAYSDFVLPKPADWGDSVEVTGYWVSDRSPAVSLPADVRYFMAQGPPPIVAAFLDERGGVRDRALRLVLEAIALMGQRCVLTGPGARSCDTGNSSSVLCAPDAPYESLLAHCSAFVHSGARSSTAAGLMAGLPQVTIPYETAQLFWGQRAAVVGVAAEPMPMKTATPDALGRVLDRVAADETMRRRADETGQIVRDERGAEKAIDAIERAARQQAW